MLGSYMHKAIQIAPTITEPIVASVNNTLCVEG